MDLVSVLLFDHYLAHEHAHEFFLVVAVSSDKDNMASARSLHSTLTTLRDTGLLANTSLPSDGSTQGWVNLVCIVTVL